MEWPFEKGPIIYLVDGKPYILNGFYSITMLQKVFYIDDELFVKDASGCYGCGAYVSLIEKFDGEIFKNVFLNNDWETLH